MVLDEQMLSTKEFFLSHHIRLSDFWLENCVEWVREQMPNCSQKELHAQVYEQWILLDLRDVDVPVLPSDLTDSKTVLNDNYSLQLQSVVDISTPKLAQLNRIRNCTSIRTEFQENEEKISAKRMLLLTLTDGLQEIGAMEYEVIPQINVNLTPGIKIRIMGPVTMRRRRILLKKENIKVLGGEVEELLVSNAAENVLARALNLPLNPNPRTVEDNPQNVDTNFITQNQTIVPNSNVNQQNPARTQQNPSGIQQNLPRNQQNIKTETNENKNDIDLEFPTDEDELLLQAELEVKPEIPEPKKPIRRSPTPDLFDDMEVDFEQIAHIEEAVIKNTPPVEVEESKPTTSLSNSPSKQNNLFMNNLRLICQLLELKDTLNRGKFKVHARFNSVLEKLTVRDDKWFLQMQIEDDTGELACCMHTDLLSELIGYPPESMKSMKESIINKDVIIVGALMNALDKFKKKLTTLDCLMDVLLERGKDPCITKLYLS